MPTFVSAYTFCAWFNCHVRAGVGIYENNYANKMKAKFSSVTKSSLMSQHDIGYVEMLRWFGRGLKVFKKTNIEHIQRPTHTEQYLAYDFHHPQSVKRGTVKCLYERAKRLVTKPSVTCKDKKDPSSVLVSNGYLLSFLQKITKTRKPSTSAEPTVECKSIAVLPYVKGLSSLDFRRSVIEPKGLSEQFRRCRTTTRNMR